MEETDLGLTNLEDDVTTTIQTQCCNTSQPAPVSEVTVENNTYNIDGLSLKMTVVKDSPTQHTIDLQVQDDEDNDATGKYKLELMFSDSAVTLRPSIVAPGSPGWAEQDQFTDASGGLQIIVQDARVQTWYLVASLGGVTEVSSALVHGS